MLDLLKGQGKQPPEMAFPVIGAIPHPNGLAGQGMMIVQSGMLLRDYFAAGAINHFLIRGNDYPAAARAAYQAADAMMEARKEVSNEKH